MKRAAPLHYKWTDGLVGTLCKVLMIEKSLNLDASDDLAEDNVVSVKPGCRGSGDEKLGTISVRALVCHRQQTRSEKAFVIISQVCQLISTLGDADWLTDCHFCQKE